MISHRYLTAPTAQYAKIEWAVSLESVNGDLPLSLDMTLQTPGGKTIHLPCFFVGEQQGRARFTPQESGTYQYHFVLSAQGRELAQSQPESFTVTPSTENGVLKGFLHAHNDWSFRYDNGEVFRGIGENIGWESRAEDDSKYFKALHEDPRFNYDYLIRKLAAHGGNFFRTWLIYWNLPVEWPTVANTTRYTNSTERFNPSALAALDQLVELCDSLGVHMMLTLEPHVALMGEGWDLTPYNQKNGGPAATPLDFFTDPVARQQYRDKLRMMVARYGYSPSIGAWEFFNEVDHIAYLEPPLGPIPHEVISEWHAEMSAYLSSIDPYDHLVTTSISHRDIDGLNDIPTLDFNQKHIYCYTLEIPGVIDAYRERHNKPYVIGEYGYHWDWSLNFNEMAVEFDQDFKHGLWLGLFTPTPILPLTWWWEFFEARGLMAYFARIRAIYDQMMAAGGGIFDSLSIQTSDKLQAMYGVCCGQTDFVYVLATEARIESATLIIQHPHAAPCQVLIYDPETDQTVELAVAHVVDGQLKVNVGPVEPHREQIIIVRQA